MTGMIHHRDAPPEETVRCIRRLLAEIGIDLAEAGWHEGIGEARSLAVVPADFRNARPCPSANGKGASAALARASAYGEFMERLQNTTRQTPVLLPRRFGRMETELADPPDAVRRSLGALANDGGAAARHLLRLNVGPAEEADAAVCFPFFNATAGRVELLPAARLFAACRSNGMAAGNSPAEALVHAVGEIFERFVAVRACRERLRLPTIPHRDLAGLSAFAAMERLTADGLRVIVKDGSLGGVYPVVAVILYDPCRNTHTIRFASDPFLDVALQRCLTEACQGLEYRNLRSRMRPLRWETDGSDRRPHPPECPPDDLERFIVTGDSPFTGAIAVSAGETRHREAFATGEPDNHRLLQLLVRVVRQQGGELLVRDVSYLGFPACYAYVPGLSDAFAGPPRRSGSRRPRRRLTRLADATPAEASEWLDAAADKAASGGARAGARDPDAISWFGLMVDEASGICRLYHSDVLFAELDCRLGRPGRAAEFLGRHIETMRHEACVDQENLDYSWCLLTALRLRALGVTGAEEAATLADMFGSRRAEEVRREIDALVRLPGQEWLPRCGDCARCALPPHCRFPSYRMLVERLNALMAARPIDQSRLADVLGDV